MPRQDPRYRTDQPFPVGSEVILIDPHDSTDYLWFCARYGVDAIGRVLHIGETTFHGHCPVLVMPVSDPTGPDPVQWPVASLVPIDQIAPVTDREALEKWLDT